MEQYFDIRQDDLLIPGLSRPVTFLHISDSHLCMIDDLTPEDEAARLQTREAFWRDGKEGFARYFGEPYTEEKRETSTGGAFERLMGYAEDAGVAAVLSTGDLFEHMHDSGVRFLKKQLEGRTFDFIAVPGNHEEAVCEGVWCARIQLFEYDGFRVVTVDDRKRTLEPETLDALEAVCREGVPVILMMHVPLLTANNLSSRLGHMDTYYFIDERTCDASGRRFLEILRSTSAVRMILCGHIHGYTVTEPVPGLRQVTAPQGMIGGGHLLTVHG